MTVLNAFNISKTNTEMAAVTRSIKAFRTHLAKEMLSGYCSRRERGVNHLIEPMPGWREGEKKEQEDCMQFF